MVHLLLLLLLLWACAEIIVKICDPSAGSLVAFMPITPGTSAHGYNEQ